MCEIFENCKVLKNYESFIQLKIKNKIKYVLKDKKKILKIKNLVKTICKKKSPFQCKVFWNLRVTDPVYVFLCCFLIHAALPMPYL